MLSTETTKVRLFCHSNVTDSLIAYHVFLFYYLVQVCLVIPLKGNKHRALI